MRIYWNTYKRDICIGHFTIWLQNYMCESKTAQRINKISEDGIK